MVQKGQKVPKGQGCSRTFKEGSGRFKNVEGEMIPKGLRYVIVGGGCGGVVSSDYDTTQVQTVNLRTKVEE